MSRTVMILTLNNANEAHILDEILKERHIPHIIRSFHDSAYDGLFQIQSGWGQLDAPKEYKEEILRIYKSLSESNA